MRTTKSAVVPAQLERVRQRFERWRRRRQGRTRIPEPLWASAAKVGAKFGLYQTAQALGLDYYSLKRHMESGSRNGCSSQEGARFLELVPAGGAGECLVELEDPRGAKMRIHLQGTGAADLAALSRSFWEGQR